MEPFYSNILSCQFSWTNSNISLNAIQQFEVHHGSSNPVCFYYKEQNKKGLKHLAFGVKLFQCYVLRLKTYQKRQS